MAFSYRYYSFMFNHAFDSVHANFHWNHDLRNTYQIRMERGTRWRACWAALALFLADGDDAKAYGWLTYAFDH